MADITVSHLTGPQPVIFQTEILHISPKELNIFKEEMIEKFGQEIIFYCPKIEHNKHFKNNIKKFERLL